MNLAEFDRCAGWISDALEYAGDTHDIEDIRRGVENGTFQFWPGEKSAVVTEIYLYPKLKACSFFLAGGEMAELQKMAREIESWARSIGCTRMLLAGRKGWARTFLAGDGYEAKWSVLAKEL